MKKNRCKLLLIAQAVLLPAAAWGQAAVDESLETAVIYVDGSKGSDSNLGTGALPFRSIGAAVSKAIINVRHGVGSRVVIQPGTYRESVTLTGTSNDASLPLTIEAATTGTAAISGADVWTGWKVNSANRNIFTHSWPYKWGLCPSIPSDPSYHQNIVRRREMIIVNGTPLTQVLGPNQVLPGSFYVDQTGGTVYIWPPSGTVMSTAKVEVATRPSLYKIYGANGTALKGLTFQYANSCRTGQAVTIDNSNNVLVENNKFLWNNAGGLKFNNSTNITSRYNVANHNGEIGVKAYHIKYWTSEYDEGSYNNWRGAQGALYAWTTGGLRYHLIHNATFTGSKTLFNQCPGFHFDTDNLQVSVDSLVSVRNLRYGAQVEISQGPTTISNSHICGNSPVNVPNHQYDAGIILNDSTYVTLTANAIADNPGSGIALQGVRGGRVITNWETGQTMTLINKYITMTQNTIRAKGSAHVFDDYLGGTEWTAFKSTLTSDYNTWWNSVDQYVFRVPMSPWQVNLAGWKLLTGDDSHSVFQAPYPDPASGCQATPDQADYWFVVDKASSSVSQGGKTSFTVSSVPLSFSGSIQLRAYQWISGAAGSWSAKSIGASGSASYTVATNSTTPKGTYPVVLIANSGSLTRTITVSLRVN